VEEPLLLDKIDKLKERIDSGVSDETYEKWAAIKNSYKGCIKQEIPI
jgi:hypothetical protein